MKVVNFNLHMYQKMSFYKFMILYHLKYEFQAQIYPQNYMYVCKNSILVNKSIVCVLAKIVSVVK